MHVIVPITLSEVFPNTRVPDPITGIKFRLKQLSRTETLRYCAHINLFVANATKPQNHLAQQLGLVRMFLNEGSVRRVERFAQDLRRQKYGNVLRLTVFHRGQLLELVRWVSQYCPESANYSDPAQNNKSKRIFVEAALLATEIMLERVYGNINLNNIADVVRQSTLGPVRKSALDASPALDPLKAFGRGHSIFTDYLPLEYPEFLHVFQEFSELSLDEYYACLFVIWAHYQDVDLAHAAQRHIIRLPALYEQIPQMAEAIRKYMALETQSPVELQRNLWGSDDHNHYNLIPLRQKPIMTLSDDTFIVIDPVFHTDKAAIGPLFMLSRHIENLMSHFGNAFENYARGVLQIMYPDKNPRLINDLKTQSRLGEEEITDACLIEDEQLLLFEVKGKWIRDDKVLQPDYEQYLNELRDKYGKAATQLARTVNKLVAGEWFIDEHDMSDTQRVYPIMIAYDTSLNVLGNAWFFATEFSNALQADRLSKGSHLVMMKGQWEVAPLIILTVDDLENLETSVSNFRFGDLLHDYIAFRDSTFHGREDSLSLREYINLSKYANKMDYRGSVVSKSVTVFEEAMKRILPPNQHDELLRQV